MNLQARKIEFVQEFLRLQSEEIVRDLEQVLRKRRIELMDENMKPMTMEQYDLEMDQAEDDSRNGRFISAEDLKAEIKKWD